NIDILICREMGKNISGTGFDTNVIGRLSINGEEEFENPNVTRLVVFDLTDESHGNALGIGLADITTKNVVDKIDFEATYTNILTSTFLRRGKLPVVMHSERRAVEAALQTCWLHDISRVKLMIIKNTLDLEYIYISKAIWEQIKDRDSIEPCGELRKITFDKEEKMQPMFG
ncbi:MAG: DUF2088 domain-containing protein, partial [Halanaerobiaceae bacterium]